MTRGQKMIAIAVGLLALSLALLVIGVAMQLPLVSA